MNLSQTSVIRNHFIILKTYSTMYVRTEHKFPWHKIILFNENKLQMDGNSYWMLCQSLAILSIVGNNKYGEKMKIFLLNFTHHLLYLYWFHLKMDVFQCHMQYYGGKVALKVAGAVQSEQLGQCWAHWINRIFSPIRLYTQYTHIHTYIHIFPWDFILFSFPRTIYRRTHIWKLSVS